MPSGITYTAVPDVRRESAGHLAICCAAIATARHPQGRARVLGVAKQAVLVLRWCVDGTGLVQLARYNGISLPTYCRYLPEGLTVLADHAPGLSTAGAGRRGGYTYLTLGGTVIGTDRVVAAGPNRADLWWSGKHKRHVGNLQVIAAAGGRPLWCCLGLASMFARLWAPRGAAFLRRHATPELAIVARTRGLDTRSVHTAAGVPGATTS